ncbi:endoribonuclease Dicer homolog 3 isoform X2 [Andrographis paniculata]|uniref:endoribonuclease Dicer homolog 3 isoform X2 n=1 Tax=Andrographis paniculata TaxID=175694 RepID=UPI0021E96F64|nr:endoribonuclease Dicer homolog 3 isoform X2 [Andrographis paniculata]
MESGEGTKRNPLKRTFEQFISSSIPVPQSSSMDCDDDHQVKGLYELAMARNVVAVSKAGVAKMVALMMIKQIGEALVDSNGDKKLIAFLTPTVDLVHKQHKEIKSHTNLRVEAYFGARGVDGWDADAWAKEINDHDVLIMTPQIFLNSLRKGYMSLERLRFIVLDECHQTTGNHPYALIMKEFYHQSKRRPKVFGMTAFPENKKDSEDRLRELESLLDSQLYGVDNTIQVDHYIAEERMICRFYDRPQPLDPVTRAELESLELKFDAVLLNCQNSCDGVEQEKCQSLRDRLARNHEKILFCLDNLGTVCAHEVVKGRIEKVCEVQNECRVYNGCVTQYRAYLREVLSVIERSSAAARQQSSKLHSLLEYLKSLRRDTEAHCIIFVERSMTAKVIARVVKKIPDFSHFNISYLTESNEASAVGISPTSEIGVSESYYGNKASILFRTYASKKRAHPFKCSSVICFDLPKTSGEYNQSRQRTFGEDPLYITFIERGNVESLNQISHIIQKEDSMSHTAAAGDLGDSRVKDLATDINLEYVVESTGASVTIGSSISLVHRYCQKLGGKTQSIQMPKFETLNDGWMLRTKLTLPRNAAFETIIGPEAHESKLSKQLVCLEACKKLHTMGALDDHLVPSMKVLPKINSNSIVKGLASAPGSTKRKELHGSVSVRLMSGTWRDKLDTAVFYAYKMHFVCNIAQQKFSSFVLLLETKLDDDVGNVDVELYLLSKFVKASIFYCGQVYLDVEKVAQAKCFQELLFNGLFGKMFVKSSGVRQLLFQSEESLWDPSNMYLLLPVETTDKASDGDLTINWTAIQSCVSTVEFLKNNALLNTRNANEVGSSPSIIPSDSGVAELNDSQVIHLANRSVPLDDLKEMVVVAIHTGRIYTILKVVADSSSESQFDGDATRYPTFATYYREKYGIALKYPGQPVLLLKQSHNSHNLLVDFRDEGMSLKTEPGSVKGQNRKPQQHAHMPPELLVGTDLRTDISKSMYLLPSLMHRLESLMLASQLREEISRHAGHFNVSSSLILEALTTQRCCENFSMERLELLGDSVLKYAVTCHLFLKNPKSHEGHLSSQRSRIVCNASLHKFGTGRKLQEYIRDCPFDPRRWTAPGQLSIWPTPCNHELDTKEVPLDERFFSEDTTLTIGKTCDKGHRWMGSKTISDCVEALLGAYFVGGGLVAAIGFMKWLGIEGEFDPSLIHDSIKAASLYSYAPKAEEIATLEAKLGYDFTTKGLLLEAITHESISGLHVGHSYERLEFLGDAVLDILITRYLYDNHGNLDPGELTDLRSASVNNDNFAIVAVRHKFHPHLLFSSSSLQVEISAFIELVSQLSGNVLAPDTKGPKVLGDLVESIAGAVLVDSKLDLDRVWKVFEPILSPIVTPDKLELPPSRELIELCDSLGYFVKQQFTTNEGVVHADLKLQLEDRLLEGQGSGPTRKAAKGMAALQLLKKLESTGISSSSKLNNGDKDNASGESITEPSISAPKQDKPFELQPETSSAAASDSCKTNIPVLPPINMRKGGPRTALYDVCRKEQWPMPAFQTTEKSFRTAIKLGDTMGFNSYKSQINLVIPGFDKIEVTGEERADKKSSFDSAALTMLLELERRGKIAIGVAK